MDFPLTRLIVDSYALQVVWQAHRAFPWLCRVPASTIMLMGDRCARHDVGCLQRWQAVSVGAGVECWRLLADVGWCCLSHPSVAGGQSVECVPAAN